MKLGILLAFFFCGFVFAEQSQLNGKFLVERYNCFSCHDIHSRVVGPSFEEIEKRYGSSEKAIEKIARLIIKPQPSNWPGMAYMPPFDIPFEQAKAIARYILIESQKEKNEEKIPADEYIDLDAQYH